MISDIIVSEFHDDPEMLDILGDFCGRLPDTICRLQQAFELHDMVAVQRIAHQMKGAGAGYGFRPLSEIGAELEALARKAEWSPALHSTADEFIRRCLIARANRPVVCSK
ncbi:Hpt domain-containing protein [bacterium]|nr:Hpt domain-containing protein [bacterium]